MITDDSQRAAMSNMGNRKMGQPKYPEKMPNYSPSTSYNYSPATGFNGGQHPRRHNDRFKRESGGNVSDRVVKQNDIIIRILKEIRDRLPPPPVTVQKPTDSAGADVPCADDSGPEEEALDEGGQQGQEVSQ